MLHLLLLVSATGFLAFGVYLVGMPLLAREGYQGGAGLFALMQVSFTLGIVAANFSVSRQKDTFKRPGRLMIISFLGRGSLVFFIALLPNFWLLFPIIFAWGAFSGLSMTLGRTILHNQVPHSHRSRAASVYQLCLFGGAPLGAWVCGYAIEHTGTGANLCGYRRFNPVGLSVGCGVLTALVTQGKRASYRPLKAIRCCGYGHIQ